MICLYVLFITRMVKMAGGLIEVHQQLLLSAAIQSIRVSNDGQWIAVKTSIGRVTLYSMDTLQVRTFLNEHFSSHITARF